MPYRPQAKGQTTVSDTVSNGGDSTTLSVATATLCWCCCAHKGAQHHKTREVMGVRKSAVSAKLQKSQQSLTM